MSRNNIWTQDFDFQARINKIPLTDPEDEDQAAVQTGNLPSSPPLFYNN